MKQRYLYFLIALVISSCGTEKFTTSNVYEDDIYYNSSLKPLSVKEMERKVPANIAQKQLKEEQNKDYISTAKKVIKDDRYKYPDITQQELEDLKIKSVTLSRNAETGLTDTIIEIMNKGFWINGFKGTQSDLDDALRTIERFPLGFGYFGNGDQIGQNLAYDSDWNVYTRDGKYWWFPTFSNINFYTNTTIGTYPRYNEIVMWNNPSYDYWDFDYHYNTSAGWSRYNHYRPFSNLYWGYNSFWFNTYDPYYYGMYPYHYGSFYPYNYRHHSYYNNYTYRNNKRKRLIRERGYNYGRTSRDRRMNYNRNRSNVVNRRNFGDPTARTRYSNRRTNYRKAGKRNTNYIRKTVKYNRPTNSSRPSYNRSYERNNNSNSGSNNSHYRSNNSNSGNNNSNSSNSTNRRVRRR